MSNAEICPRFEAGPWKFTGECNWDKRADHHCEYCGSMNPDDLMARFEAGDVMIIPTDKNYKIYVRNKGGAPLLRTYRKCPPEAGCKGPDDCTHWVTEETSQDKFYFQHFSVAQRIRFVELINLKKINFVDNGSFYVMPFFMAMGRASPKSPV